MRPDFRSRSRSSRGLVFLDRRDVLEVVAGEGRVRGRHLHAERLAFQRFLQRLERGVAAGLVLVEVDQLAGAGELGERAGFRRGEGRRDVRIGDREVDLLLALVGDRHAVHDDVELAGLQAGNHAVPILRDDLAFDLHPRADVHRDVGLEADDLAARIGQIVGLVGALHADDHGLPVLGARRAGEDQERACERRTQYVSTSHLCTPMRDSRPSARLRIALIENARPCGKWRNWRAAAILARSHIRGLEHLFFCGRPRKGQR